MKPIKHVIIHCKPEALDSIKELDLWWDYSPRFGNDEIDVQIIDHNDFDDEELCESIGLDYDQVNCIEMA